MLQLAMSFYAHARRPNAIRNTVRALLLEFFVEISARVKAASIAYALHNKKWRSRCRRKTISRKSSCSKCQCPKIWIFSQYSSGFQTTSDLL